MVFSLSFPLMLLLLLPFVAWQVGYYFYIQLRDKQFRLTDTVMGCCEGVIWVFVLLIFFELYAKNDPFLLLFFQLYSYGFLIYFGLAIGITGVLYLTKTMPRVQKYREALITRVKYADSATSEGVGTKIKRDLSRKFTHILFFICMFVAFRITVAVMIHMGIFPGTPEEVASLVWEVRPEIILWPWQWYGNIGIFHMVMMFIFLVTHEVMFQIEVFRKSTKWFGPLSLAATKLLKPKEINSIASFTPFMTGLLFASMFLPPYPVFALIYLMVVADTAASQYGMRKGRKRIPWNPSKSLGGTVAGYIASFGCILFVGPAWGIIGAFVFVFTDLITEKPIDIADNLLIPVLGTGAFLYMFAMGIPYAPLAFMI
jgi:dolichol kinase